MSLVWALTWLVRSAALAALTAAFVRLTGCRANAAARYVAWALSFALCAGLLAWPTGPAAATAAATPFAPEGAPYMPAAASLPLVVLPEPVISLSGWLELIWGLGAAAGLALAGLDVWRVLRLKRRTVPLTAHERARLEAGLSSRTPSRAPRLAWCDDLDTPAVLGFSRPVIALPRSQMSCLPDGQARLVMMHELAHVRRGDDWWALAERIVLALTWVNPAVHWVRRELSLAREMACDEWVVRQTAAPVAYAKCLADVAGRRTRARRLRLAAGVAGRPGSLRRRVVGVLAFDHRPSSRAIAQAAWFAPVAVCVLAAGLLQLPPVIAVARPSGAAPAAPESIVPTRMAGRAAADVLVSSAGTVRRASPEHRASPARRLVHAAPAPVPDDAAGGGPVEAQAVQVVAAEQNAAASHAPLVSSPLPGAGVAGVIAAGDVPGAFPPQIGPRGAWWSGPVELGKATGGAAATAGRATASFFARLGSHAPQLLKL